MTEQSDKLLNQQVAWQIAGRYVSILRQVLTAQAPALKPEVKAGIADEAFDWFYREALGQVSLSPLIDSIEDDHAR